MEIVARACSKRYIALLIAAGEDGPECGGIDFGPHQFAVEAHGGIEAVAVDLALGQACTERGVADEADIGLGLLRHHISNKPADLIHRHGLGALADGCAIFIREMTSEHGWDEIASAAEGAPAASISTRWRAGAVPGAAMLATVIAVDQEPV